MDEEQTGLTEEQPTGLRAYSAKDQPMTSNLRSLCSALEHVQYAAGLMSENEQTVLHNQVERLMEALS